MKTTILFICILNSISIVFSQRMIKASNCDCLYNTEGTFTWSGSSVNGYCDGYGCIQWYDNYGNKSNSFCGNIKNGKNEGLGRHYDKYGKLIFEGMYVNDLKNGFGTSYNNGKIVFQGKYINGQRSFGSEYLSDGSNIYYIGEYADGKINGKGVFYRNYNEGKIWYRGQSKSGLFHGFGTSYFDNGKVEYEGEWYLDNMHGNGVLYNEAGKIVFKGRWINGNRTGSNLAYVQTNETTYKNSYTNNSSLGCISGDCSDGYGTYIYNNGDKYEGYFRSGVRSGSGTYNYNDGNKYVGNFLYGKKNGNGSYFENGSWVYDGVYKDDVLSYKTKERTSSNSSDLKDLVTGAIIVGGAIALVNELFSSNSSSSSSKSSSTSSSIKTNNQNSSNSNNYGKFVLGSKWFWVSENNSIVSRRYVYCFRVIDYTATKVQFESEGKICEETGFASLYLSRESQKLNYTSNTSIDVGSGKTFWMYRSDCENQFYTFKPSCEN